MAEPVGTMPFGTVPLLKIMSERAGAVPPPAIRATREEPPPAARNRAQENSERYFAASTVSFNPDEGCAALR
jgi:hypothetical protein